VWALNSFWSWQSIEDNFEPSSEEAHELKANVKLDLTGHGVSGG
jgi:hypothetical protein